VAGALAYVARARDALLAVARRGDAHGRIIHVVVLRALLTLVHVAYGGALNHVAGHQAEGNRATLALNIVHVLRAFRV